MGDTKMSKISYSETLKNQNLDDFCGDSKDEKKIQKNKIGL